SQRGKPTHYFRKAPGAAVSLARSRDPQQGDGPQTARLEHKRDQPRAFHWARNGIKNLEGVSQMTKTNSGGLAFPCEEVKRRQGGAVTEWTIHGGMTKRQYAAIHLCIPDSGSDWLDDM